MPARRYRLATRSLAVFALGMGAIASQGAGNMAGQLLAQMVLQPGCMVSGASASGGAGVNLGTLDFGAQPATFMGVLTASPTGGAGGAGGTQIVCSPEVTALSVAASAGNHAGQGSGVGTGSRALRFGTSYLPYEVYSDAAMTSAYPTSGNAVGVTLPPAGTAFALPVFGRIHKTSGNAMAPGTYTDVLQVTISW